MTKDVARDSRTGELPAWARSRPEGLALALHVQPGARASRIAGEHGERLKICLRAPPVEGRANEELLRFLAQTLALPANRLHLTSGAASRQKTVLVHTHPQSAHELVTRLCTGK